MISGQFVKVAIFIQVLSLGGCISTSREREMQNEIFTLKAKVLELENTVSSSKEKGSEDETNLSKRIATTNTQIDRMDVKLKKIVGELDALKVGVTLGQMPGTEPDPNSVASKLEQFDVRLQAIEEAQINHAKNSQGKNNSESNSKSKKNNLQSLADFRDAFEQKRFRQVVDDSGSAIKSLKGDQRKELEYLVAESTYKLGNIREAALKFNELSESAAPKSNLKKKTLLRLGDSFRHLGDKATAKIYYTELAKDFAETEEGISAQERLSEIDKE